MEVRQPLEHALVVPRAQRPEQDVVRVQPGMPPPPLLDRRRTDRVGARCALGLVPRLELRIDQVPRELVHDEQRRESGEPRDRLVERIEVMDDAPGDDGVELALHLAKVDLTETRSRRRARVDADRVVTRVDERRHDAAAIAAPDFEHPRRSGWQVM